MRTSHKRLNSNEEVDLFQFMMGIWKRKLSVVLIAVAITAAAVAYALWVKPEYEAQVYVQPPSQNDIAQLNYGRGGDSGLGVLTARDVFGAYIRVLQSEAMRRKFFKEYYLPSLTEEARKGSQDVLYARFNQVLTAGPVNKEVQDRFYIKASLPDPQLAATWVTHYVKMAGDKAKQDVIRDAKADAIAKADNLEQQILQGRQSTTKQREDRIAQLNEALKIATSIGLKNPPLITNSLSTEVSAGMEGALTYMRGSNALEAEVENLKSRKSDDPFVANLRQRQEALGFYKTLKIDPAVIEVYTQDGAIQVPDRPVKPNKRLIVFLGGLLGLSLGGGFALLGTVREIARRRTSI